MATETRSAHVMVRLRPSVKAALERAAKADDRPVSSLIATIVAQWLRDKGYLKEPARKT